MTRVLSALVAVAALSGLATAAAPAAGAAGDLRSERSALLLRSAELHDRLEAAQSGVVAAQMRQARARDALGRMRDRMRTRAVRAYVKGPGTLSLAVKAPRAYLEVAASKERELVEGYRSASSTAGAEQDRAEHARDDLRRAYADLAQVQGRLEAVISAEEARRSEEQRAADQARLAALASTPTSGGPPGAASPGGYAPSPLDPLALVPRHRAATERQLALMRRIPFGQRAPGSPLPAGLAATGQRVVGIASWYGPGFNGRPTASGAIYDQEAWTVASKELPLGTILLVSRGDREVLVLVNDRGPYVDDRVLDLSAAAARALGLGGVGPVVAMVVGSA